jgi:2-methylisocitrate lyase-like PEP mutase family enzyme
VSSVGERRAAFKQLHWSGCFVIPNPWDAGTARYLEHVGFPALATTSSGMAFARARPDGGVTVDEVIAHIATIVEATDLPVNADFEDGFASGEPELAENVKRCAETGVAALSIEDAPVDPSGKQYELDVAVARLGVARRALDETHPDVLLVARPQNRMSDPADIDDTVRRIEAYAGAGADVIYVPGAHTDEQIATVVAAAGPRPVNVLARAGSGMTVAGLAALGVRRISVGGGLARVAWAAVAESAREMLEGGDLGAAMGPASSSPDLNSIFGS